MSLPGFGDTAAAASRNTKCEKGVQIRNLDSLSAVLRSLSLRGVTGEQKVLSYRSWFRSKDASGAFEANTICVTYTNMNNNMVRTLTGSQGLPQNVRINDKGQISVVDVGKPAGKVPGCGHGAGR